MALRFGIPRTERLTGASTHSGPVCEMCPLGLAASGMWRWVSVSMHITDNSYKTCGHTTLYKLGTAYGNYNVLSSGLYHIIGNSVIN